MLLGLAGCVLAAQAQPPAPVPAIGEVFRDALNGGGEGPEMVVIASGSFMMGSPSGEAGRVEDEDDKAGPGGSQVQVTLAKAFAVGKYEVTWAEWEACVADGGCSNSGPDSLGGDASWGKGSRPVINVDWNDTQAYVNWLSGKTGETYRLLSEAEWEYVARAGTSTPFYFGKTITPDQANYDGNYTYNGGLKGTYHRKTMPVGSYPRNAFGLHDLHGNVWEWTQDCYVNSYSGTLTHGSVQTVSNCVRVLRGGSAISTPQFLRSAGRIWNQISYRYSNVGFRVARTL